MGGPPSSPAIRMARQDVRIPPLGLPGILQLPEPVRALVVFAHGSGSSRLSPRNTAVAGAINSRGMATLLFDLLTEEEEDNRANVFDIPLLAGRLTQAVQWVGQQPQLQKLPIGLFGASTGAAAALVAAAHLGARIGAVVSRGGRPDLAAPILGDVKSPTLLIVGGLDTQVIGMNRSAFSALSEPKAMQIVPNASHLFSEPGTMEAVIAHATRWFELYLCADAGMSQA